MEREKAEEKKTEKAKPKLYTSGKDAKFTEPQKRQF